MYFDSGNNYGGPFYNEVDVAQALGRFVEELRAQKLGINGDHHADLIHMVAGAMLHHPGFQPFGSQAPAPAQPVDLTPGATNVLPTTGE